MLKASVEEVREFEAEMLAYRKQASKLRRRSLLALCRANDVAVSHDATKDDALEALVKCHMGGKPVPIPERDKYAEI